jgi:hypothetical protein
MLERLVDLADHSDAIMADAVRPGGDSRLALAAIRESREVIGAISRLVGPDAGQMVEESQQLARALARVLPRHLDAATDLADQLQATGSDDLATAISEMVNRAVCKARL